MKNKDISQVRTDYTRGSIQVNELPSDPFKLFSDWLQRAKEETDKDYNAMVVSTIDGEGFPQSRIVLLRMLDTEGLVFYTNYESDKGNQIDINPNGAINFFWKELERQVRLVGQIEKVSKTQSDSYFASRPRASQIGAWASDQSSPISDRGELEQKVAFFEEKFEGKNVPRPPHWGGYKLLPHRFEFWQGRASRLHDRVVYQKGATWETHTIQP